MLRKMLERRRGLKTLDELKDFEVEVDDFAKMFVGARGEPPARGTFHVVDVSKKR
jgi:hypothetical protein